MQKKWAQRTFHALKRPRHMCPSISTIHIHIYSILYHALCVMCARRCALCVRHCSSSVCVCVFGEQIFSLKNDDDDTLFPICVCRHDTHILWMRALTWVYWMLCRRIACRISQWWWCQCAIGEIVGQIAASKRSAKHFLDASKFTSYSKNETARDWRVIWRLFHKWQRAQRTCAVICAWNPPAVLSAALWRACAADNFTL